LSSPFRLEGVFTVLPTAFHDDGALDLPGTAAVARAAVDAKVSGLTVLGVMGEAAELTEDERREVVACVRSVVSIPIVVGVSGGTLGEVSSRAADAASSGVDALMVSPAASLALGPAVAAAATAGLPIVVQDYPAGSGVHVTTTELATVATGQPLVVGVKAEAPPSSGRIASLRATNPDLGLLGGLGGLFLIDELRAGANGVMTGFALPEQLVSVVEIFRSDEATATATWEALLPLMRLEAFQPFSLAARKEVWRLRGVIESSHCRRPGAVLGDRARDDVRRAFERVNG
jgi:4-hydroxy-tetrahydrodipicolinate synthase